MPRVSALILLVLLAPQAPGDDSLSGATVFAVAATDGQSTCLLGTPGVFRQGDPVVIVDPNLPQRFVRGVVGEPLARPCHALSRSLLSGEAFALGLDKQSLTPNETCIATRAHGASFEIRDGRVRAMLPGAQEPVQFRICASMEGLHLTVWRGEPLHSLRIWHEYVYLGYDISPDCADADTAGLLPNSALQPPGAPDPD